MNTNKKTPKLRFKGFTDDWEQCKLKSIANTIVAGGDIDKNKIKESGTYPVIANALTKDGVVGYYEDTYRIEAPAVTVTGRGDIGVAKARHQNFTPVVRLLSLTTAHDVDFIENAINNLKIVSESTGVAQLTVPQLSNYKIHITSILEERKIGLFISKVDNLITLHQRKLEKLKLNKSALLQKLFPQKGCTIPDVRFKGFTDAWEQRKLNDFGIATGGTSIESEFVDGGTYKVINIGSYSEESVYNDQGLRVNKTDKTKSRILNKYDLTMILNDKTASGNIIGRVLLIDQDNTYVYNQRTERIEVDTKNFLPMFLYHMLNAPEQRKYIVKASQGNTQIYVNWSTISNIDYMIPQLLLEQEKIANLFSLINKDITLHQRKLDCLISIKKGLLQQLFV